VTSRNRLLSVRRYAPVQNAAHIARQRRDGFFGLVEGFPVQPDGATQADTLRKHGVPLKWLPKEKVYVVPPQFGVGTPGGEEKALGF
jgi:hypothetical protein